MAKLIAGVGEITASPGSGTIRVRLTMPDATVWESNAFTSSPDLPTLASYAATVINDTTATYKSARIKAIAIGALVVLTVVVDDAVTVSSTVITPQIISGGDVWAPLWAAATQDWAVAQSPYVAPPTPATTARDLSMIAAGYALRAATT